MSCKTTRLGKHRQNKNFRVLHSNLFENKHSIPIDFSGKKICFHLRNVFFSFKVHLNATSVSLKSFGKRLEQL